MGTRSRESLAALQAWARAPWRVAVCLAPALAFALAGALPLALASAQTASAETLRDALMATYKNNPRLDAERARLRATDEEVPRAQSGYRPIISGTADYGYQETRTKPTSSSSGNTNPYGYGVTVSQNIFKGFQTVNGVRQAEARVRAGRENLRHVEQQVLLEAVAAFADVIRDRAIVRLREGNVALLTRELEAAEARRAVREVTRTDVAQAQARLAKAVSELDEARGNLKISHAGYIKAIGHAPGKLVQPGPPLRLLPASPEDARQIAERESPNVISALFREQAARFGVDRVRGELLPEVRLEAGYSQRYDPGSGFDEQNVGSITGRVSIPLYEGGETRARVRQAKHQHVSSLQEIEQARAESVTNAVTAWTRLETAKAQMRSDRRQVEAAKVVLEGVREEEKVGQRTLLDVLNAAQELLDARVRLASTQRNVVVAAFSMLASLGRLNAEELDISDAVYDPKLHYNDAQKKWLGISISHADGRLELMDAETASDAWFSFADPDRSWSRVHDIEPLPAPPRAIERRSRRITPHEVIERRPRLRPRLEPRADSGLVWPGDALRGAIR